MPPASTRYRAALSAHLLPVLLGTGLGVVGAERGAAQTLPEITATPEAAAEMFIRSVRSTRWSAAAQFVDPETLVLFRNVVTMITEVEEAGALLAYLTDTDTTGYRALSSAEIFGRALRAITDDMPGLSNSLYDRDDEILGHVTEGRDTAHVVYRTVMRLSGAVPEVRVMQVRRGAEGWRVLWSEELDVLETALRGARRLVTPRRPPPRPPDTTAVSADSPQRVSIRPLPRVISLTPSVKEPTSASGTPQSRVTSFA